MVKRSTAIFLVLILAVIAALPAFADTGPKPSLTLTVKNPPDEPYYIDLLMQKALCAATTTGSPNIFARTIRAASWKCC